MTACIYTALAQLRRAHPQWGWGVNPQGVICGEREGVATCSICQGEGGGWQARVTVWPLADEEDGEGVDQGVVRAFEAARKAARLEVVR
jgi:hypothetical protein